MAAKAKTGEALVKELARKEFNKKCFDCGRGGPQQNVNLTLNTFVCTGCSGLLRNFNHQVKTINMYTFKPAEVQALEDGGNKKAAKYWMHFYEPDNPREFKVDMDDPKSVLEMMKLRYDAKKWSTPQHCTAALSHTAASTLPAPPLTLLRLPPPLFPPLCPLSGASSSPRRRSLRRRRRRRRRTPTTARRVRRR